MEQNDVTVTLRIANHPCKRYYTPALGAFWNTAIHSSVPWCSCLGYKHACCPQLSHRRRHYVSGLSVRLCVRAAPGLMWSV